MTQLISRRDKRHYGLSQNFYAFNARSRHKADMLGPYNLARFYQKLLFFDERADLIYVAAFVARRFYDAKFFIFERDVLYPHDGVKFVVYTNARVAKCVIVA